MMRTKLTGFIVVIIIVLVFGKTNAYAKDSSTPAIKSESAIMIDAKTGRTLLGKHENAQMYPASLTKVATAIYAIEKGNLHDQVKISPAAAAAVGSSVYVTAGETIPLLNLVQGFLINSGNDAGVAIAEHLSGSQENFATDLNTFLQTKVKTTGTNFTNPHGLFDKNHYTTADDLAKITQFAMKNPIFRDAFSKKELPWHVKTWDTTLITHHRLLKGEQPYKGITGGKTGFVSKSGHTLITSAKRGNMELIAVTLKSTSARQAYNDTKSMLNYGFSHFTTSKIDKSKRFSVKGKTFSLKQDLYYTQLKDDTPVFKTEKNGILEVKNQIGEVMQSFDLELVANAEEMPKPKPDQKELKDTQGKRLFYPSLLVLFLLLCSGMFVQKRRAKKRRNKYHW
ncbi:D-alanyl-D-alanine carboxypeptidase family protein [Peribacillus sp. SCS-155]|uniref:D-alanyl-D-alanine carboxypeptidase family protein n=1 Tax=Peribacillus sedimenti TaxID=3115297 RepID=UPI003906A193